MYIRVYAVRGEHTEKERPDRLLLGAKGDLYASTYAVTVRRGHNNSPRGRSINTAAKPPDGSEI